MLTTLPLKQILRKPDASGRLMKWAMELSEFDISYKPRASVNGQALANFIAEFVEAQAISMDVESSDAQIWNLFVDGSFGETLCIHLTRGPS